MHEPAAPAWSVTLSADASTMLRRHSALALEYAALDAARRALRWAELSAPVHAWLSRRHIRLIRDVPYLGSGHPAHLLDVYRQVSAEHSEQHPVVMYVHGGGFEVGSKNTHWVMAQSYARRGYVVFNVNYRLAPKYPFPLGLMDVCAAYQWVLDNAARFGGDPRRIVIAGESAGANLVSSLALIASVDRPEPWASAVFRRHAQPSAVVAACGLFEVSNAHRFRSLARESWEITKRAIEQVGRAYLPGPPRWAGEHDLANPLLVLERREALDKPLPPFFVACGTMDPLLDDSRRLALALASGGVEHEARYYDGEIHAFHAMWWRAQARRYWRDAFRFIAQRLDKTERTESVAA